MPTYFGSSDRNKLFRRLLVDVVYLGRGKFLRDFVRGCFSPRMPTPALMAASFAFFFSSSVISFRLADRLRSPTVLDGKNLFHNQPLRDHRFEFVEH